MLAALSLAVAIPAWEGMDGRMLGVISLMRSPLAWVSSSCASSQLGGLCVLRCPQGCAGSIVLLPAPVQVKAQVPAFRS